MLKAADAARLAEAFSLLQRGRSGEAGAIADDVAARSPESADALHMLALCRKATGDHQGAIDAFEAARVRAPDDTRLLGNYANLLCRLGRTAEAIEHYRRALARSPAQSEGWYNLGLALLDVGDAVGAQQALERAVALSPKSPSAWQALGSARRSVDDLEGAETALRRAVSLDSGNGAAWTSLGVVRRLLGDPTDALGCYQRAREAGFSGPELEDAQASAQLDLGEVAQALETTRRLTASAPAYTPGHTMLAHILWEHGDPQAPGLDPREAFRAAVEAQPGNRRLRLDYINFLIQAASPEEALEQVRRLRSAEDEPALAALEAHALELLERPEEAGDMFARAHAAMPATAQFLNLYVHHLLRVAKPEAAAELAIEALELEPANQLALAYLGLAWRLCGDPREDWLCGYDRLVAEVVVEPPPGFADEAAFLSALEATLLPLHTARREPVNQSLRGGSQTSGVLFGRREPALAALRDAIAAAVSGYVSRLPEDASHPFLRRKAARVRFKGSWSVRLWSAGRHVNHFHQEGWISSAFYVALPPSVLEPAGGDSAGFIQFGEPPTELGLALGPRRVVQPKPGRLVLFPSYLWHGTVPFQDDEPRLTVAFDAVPAG
jgi:tetratricopeptide (TPR) repeat protein